jgi:hypothetical protein
LKKEDIGGPDVLMQEDPYSEVLIQSISFIGGPYLVSAGSGEHAVADLENLLDALFREPRMPDDLRGPARQLILGILTVSDLVLKRAGLTRGTSPGGSVRTSIGVPSAARLRELSEATFISNDELDAHGSWLRMVIDTFALDPGQLVEPCADDITDDRLYVTPFLRLTDGYRVVLPLDLLIAIRFHLLRFALQAGQLEELGRRWREAALRRFMRLAPSGSSPVLLEKSDLMSRYLLEIDGKRDLHIVVATDPLVDWHLEVWGSCDTHAALVRIADLVSPSIRGTYSSADELLHLVITDSPGERPSGACRTSRVQTPCSSLVPTTWRSFCTRSQTACWACCCSLRPSRSGPGESMSTDILDEFCSYVDHEKSFYSLTTNRPLSRSSSREMDCIRARSITQRRTGTVSSARAEPAHPCRRDGVTSATHQRSS